MSKIYIALTNPRSIFHDTSQGATVTGSEVVAVKESLYVTRALRNGAVVRKTEEEYEAQFATKEADVDPNLDGGGTEDVSGTTGEGAGNKEANKEVLEYPIMLKADLVTLAESRGIEVDPKATKDAIIALLQAYDAVEADEANKPE